MLARLSLLDGAVIVAALAAIGAVLRYFLAGQGAAPRRPEDA